MSTAARDTAPPASEFELEDAKPSGSEDWCRVSQVVFTSRAGIPAMRSG